MSDIDVQRGAVEFVPNTGTTVTLGTSLGSLGSAFVRTVNSRRMCGGFQTSASNMEVDDLSLGIQLTDVDTLEVGRESGSAATTTFGTWETWEYTGATSGPNEFIVRGRYQLTLTGESTTQVVSGITDIDNCIPFITGLFSDSGADDADHATAVAWMSSIDTLNVSRGSGSADTTRVWVTVVEFTGSAWSVRHGRSQSAADTGTITLVAAADGLTGSASGVADWADALITHQFRSNNLDGTNDNVCDVGAVYFPNGLTGVDWAFSADHADAGTAGNEGIHFVHVLEHADMAVTRYTDTSIAGGATSIDVTSAGLTSMSTAAVEISRATGGTTRAYARGWVNAELTSTTNVDIATHRSCATNDTRIQVADFEGIVTSVGGPVLEATLAGSSTTTGTMSGTGAMSGTLAAAAGLVAALTLSGGLAATLNSSSTTSGTLTGTGAMSATLAGSSTTALNNSSGILGTDAVVAFIGNSYTQNYGSLPALLEYYLGERIGGSTVDLDAPPHLGTSIANSGTDGYYPGMTIAGMCLYPTVDQSSGGSTDAIDALDSVAIDTYDSVVMTSGFRRDDGAAAGLDYELPNGIDPGANANTYGVNLEVARQVAALIRAETSGTVTLRMTQEGFNANDDTDLTDVERITQIQVLGARQLESEGVVDYVVPDHYVWGRLMWGAFGTVGSGVTTAVPAYSSLTHTNSLQPGGANLAWLNRSQGDTGFTRNGHQNALATIVHAWIWGYAMWGIDPRGDTTFTSRTGLPSPFDEMLSVDGTRIYGGHNTGLGNTPYDTGVNPSGPPDSELDLDWSVATQLQIQDRIVAAIDDYNNSATEWDGVAMSATLAGSSATTGTLTGTGAMGATLGSSSTTTATMSGTGAMAAQLDSSSTTTGTMVVPGVLAATLAGSSATVGTLTGVAAMTATLGASSSLGGALSGVTVMQAALAATSGASGTLTGTGAMSATLAGISTTTVNLGGYDASSWTTIVQVPRSNPVIVVTVA